MQKKQYLPLTAIPLRTGPHHQIYCMTEFRVPKHPCIIAAILAGLLSLPTTAWPQLAPNTQQQANTQPQPNTQQQANTQPQPNTQLQTDTKLQASSHPQANLPPNLDHYIDTVLRTFNVPGISLAIVKDGKLLLAKGYGIKRTGHPEKIDEHTLFPIASNTKAFTAMALAILVDEGKLKWDDPVIDHLPWFRMSDPWVTMEMTIRDLLVHHSGIPAFAGDILLFPPSTYTRREILEKIKKIPLVNSFRTTYAYDNILYVAAGEVISNVSHMDWEDFIRTRILEKMGMTESLSRFSALGSKTNTATGHIRNTQVPGILAVDGYIEQEIGDAADPAGGICSNAVDMGKWLRAQLDSGRGPGATSDLWKIVTPIDVGDMPDELAPAQMDFCGYALGMRVFNYGPYKVAGHGGKLDGYVSQVILVPKLRLGIAVLTNQETTGAYWSITYHLLDYFMGNPHFDWVAGYKRQLDSSRATLQRAWQKTLIKPQATARTTGQATARTTNPAPVPALAYLGKYSDRFYGDILIQKDSTGSGLTLQFTQTPQFVARLQPFQDETFKAVFQNPALRADSYISFTLGPDGEVESCKLKVIDPASDISFDDLNFVKDK
jgi:CubicO group peptidase (beta-lactamase class C family)